MISLKSMYKCITLNKVSCAFFFFSVVHCLSQGILQSLLYSIDLNSCALTTSILDEAEVPRGDLPWLTHYDDQFKLKICTDVPFGKRSMFCTTVFDSGLANETFSTPGNLRRSVNVPQIRSDDDGASDMQPFLNSSGDVVGMTMNIDGNTVTLDAQCTRLLTYPNQLYGSFMKEDAALIALQFYLSFLSFISIVFESVPHLISVLLSRVLVVFWCVFATWRNGPIESQINTLIADAKSPCHVDLFPGYFQNRMSYQVSILVLETISLPLTLFFSHKLIKVYNAQTFKIIGPPKNIVRIHRIFLAFFVCLQISVFCLVTATGLWISELIGGPISQITTKTKEYLGIFIVSMIFIVPWVTMGWFAVRREMKKLMAAFLFIGVCFITLCGVMFDALVFRWTFLRFPFFAAVLVEAFVVMIASCIFGAICWKNFDKGLAHYLYAEGVLGQENFEPGVFTHDIEKGTLDLRRDTPTFISLRDLKENNL